MNEPEHSQTATREADVAEPIVTDARARLVLLVSTAQETHAFELGARLSVTLGRAEPADFLVTDPSLSRLHARVAREGDAVRVTDLGSRNGTWLRGERVREAVLRPGEALAMGGATLTVQLTAPATAVKLGILSSGELVRRVHDEWTRAAAFRRSLAVLAIREPSKNTASLAELATALSGRLRAIDGVGLYTNDCLLIVLPELNGNEAFATARSLVEPLRGRVACGVAAYPAACSTPEQLISAALDAAARTSASETLRAAPNAPHVRDGSDGVAVRASASTLALSRIIQRLAARPISVLIHGETGTGKELVARELHECSPRAACPLKVVNCAAIPDSLVESLFFGHEKGSFTGADREHKGVFEQAHGGTVFLDEVGELGAGAQASLLRVLDTGRVTRLGATKEIAVDVRVVAATHRDLLAMTGTGAFRLDLYHRLNGVTLVVPPLRERPEEIALLAQHFASTTAQRWNSATPRFEAPALEQLSSYRWPGNVRELRNVIERAMALCDGEVITPADLPDHVRAGEAEPAPSLPIEPSSSGTAALRDRLLEHEAALIRDALRRAAGNQRKAAELVQLPLRTFQRRVSELGLVNAPDE